jgi:hypothetical protein
LIAAVSGLNSRTAHQAHTLLRQRLRVGEGLAAAAAYAVVLVVVYNNIVFFGDSLVYSNNLNMIDFRMTSQTYGPGFSPANVWSDRNLDRTANLQDPGAAWTQWEASGVFLRRSLGQGELPFWDPYTGGGVPAMTNLTQAFFFPPSLLLVGLGNTVLLKNAYFLALLMMAGWCTWCLLRRSGLSWQASFFGGLTFMLSGGLSSTVGSFIGQTACCLPVGLLATRWFLERSSWAAAAALGLVFGSVALASFPPLLFAIFSLCAVYACTELVWGACVKAPRQVAAMRFVSGSLLGIGLVAFYYLPAFSLVSLLPHVTSFYQDASSQTRLPAWAPLQLLAPALMGGVPVWANDPIPQISAGAFHYVGAVPLLMVVLAGTRHLRRPLWFVALCGAILAIGLMVGVAPFAQIRNLPVLRTIHFGNYYGIVLDFLLALLAAAGFERLREKGVSAVRGWAATSIVLIGLFMILLIAFDLKVSSHPAYLDWLARYKLLLILTLVASTLMFTVSGDLATRRHAPYCTWALLSLVLVEGTFNSWFPRQQRWEAWTHPPSYVAYLQRETSPGRVFTMGGVLYANSGSAFDVVQLDSMMTFNPPRIFDLYRRYANPKAYLFLREAVNVPPEPVLDAAGISHLAVLNITPAFADLKARGHELVFTDGFIQIFRRSGLPRYFFTSEFTVSSERDALEAVGLPRPQREIVVERPPPFLSRPNLAMSVAPVRVDRFSNNHVQLSLVAPRAGFVYASDSFFPGWRATVNGKAAPIEPANYAFRAVQVPPGSVTIELRYVPPGLWLGLGISGISVVIVAGLLGSAARAAATRELRNENT